MRVADAFLKVGKMIFFYNQTPESMKSLEISCSKITLWVENFTRGFLLSMLSCITERENHRGWTSMITSMPLIDVHPWWFSLSVIQDTIESRKPLVKFPTPRVVIEQENALWCLIVKKFHFFYLEERVGYSHKCNWGSNIKKLRGVVPLFPTPS